MRVNSSHTTFTNGVFMSMWSLSMIAIGGLVSNFLLYLGFAMYFVVIILWILSYEINLFMDKPVKIGSYIYYDFKNDPVSYIIVPFCFLIACVWLYADWVTQSSFNFDSLLGFYCSYFILSVMVLYGYIKEYDKLP